LFSTLIEDRLAGSAQVEWASLLLQGLERSGPRIKGGEGRPAAEVSSRSGPWVPPVVTTVTPPRPGNPRAHGRGQYPADRPPPHRFLEEGRTSWRAASSRLPRGRHPGTTNLDPPILTARTGSTSSSGPRAQGEVKAGRRGQAARGPHPTRSFREAIAANARDVSRSAWSSWVGRRDLSTRT